MAMNQSMMNMNTQNIQTNNNQNGQIINSMPKLNQLSQDCGNDSIDCFTPTSLESLLDAPEFVPSPMVALQINNNTQTFHQNNNTDNTSNINKGKLRVDAPEFCPVFSFSTNSTNLSVQIFSISFIILLFPYPLSVSNMGRLIG